MFVGVGFVLRRDDDSFNHTIDCISIASGQFLNRSFNHPSETNGCVGMLLLTSFLCFQLQLRRYRSSVAKSVLILLRYIEINGARYRITSSASVQLQRRQREVVDDR